jgi:hypothetical protein
VRPPQYNDIVRIRPEAVPQWQNALQDTLYGGHFLRGTALELQIRPNERGSFDTVLLFRPAVSREERSPVWQIPIAQLQNIAQRFGLDTTAYGGWNVVETYGVTEHIPTVRSIPVRFLACDCLPLGIGLPGFALRCPERRLPWYFIELRGVAGGYTDLPTRTSRQGWIRYSGELAVGMRFGTHRQWGIGLVASPGMPLYNSFRTELLRRPLTLLHLRYQFGSERVIRRRERLFHIDPTCGPVRTEPVLEEEELSSPATGCIRPFLYGQLGLSVDRLTLRMARFWLAQKQQCSDCVRFLKDLEASGQLPEVDFSAPLSYGLGIGVEVAATSWMDLALDLGWRSLAIGEETALLGFQNVPSTRRLHMLLFRAGVTF